LVIFFFILGTAGLWIPLTIFLFLLQIVAWVFGSTLTFADLLRRFIAGLVPLKPLTGAADCLISALLGAAALFYYGLQTAQPEWIIAAGAFPVMFGHLGDKLLFKPSVTVMETPVKTSWTYYSPS